jgi:hypothetical protein
MATHQHIIEIESGRWTGNANAATLALPSEPCVQCSRLTSLIPVGEDD